MVEQKQVSKRVGPAPSRPHLPEGYGVPPGDEGMLPWSHVSDRLAQSRNYWIVTARPDGRPHAVPLWGAWVEETLYVEGGTETRWGRNIAANPAVAVHLESGDDVVILEGVVEEARGLDPSLAARIAEAYAAKYKDYRPNPDDWREGGLYALRLRMALAWTSFPTDATRWRFNAG